MRPTIVSFLVSALGLLGCREVEVHTATLVMLEATHELRLGTSLPRDSQAKITYTAFGGFGCVDLVDADETDHPNSLLLARAYSFEPTPGVTQAALRASVVVDVIRLGGYPRCRGSEIYSYCADHPCAPIESERLCVDLDGATVLLSGNRLEKAEILADRFHDYLKQGLDGRLFTSGGLDEEVLIRVVGTTQSCTELELQESLAFDETKLLGCSYSCPVVPSAARGEISLDLDTLSPSLCEPAVRACAGELFSPAGADPGNPIDLGS